MICKAFPDCLKLDEWKILSGGAVNTIYEFRIGPNRFVLRLYVRDRAHCKMEKIIHKLIEGRVLAPKLIYADEIYIPWAYAIFEFIDGDSISNALEEQKKILSYQLGCTLASIHCFKLPQAGLFGDGMSIAHPFEIGSSPYFEETVAVLTYGKYVVQRLGHQLVKDMLEFLNKNKTFFPKVDDTVCLIHSDFKPVNLLYKGEKIFVLDWEFAHAGIGIVDFAILLRYRHQFPCDISALSKGYTDFGGHLPENWFRSALITDFVNIVTLLESPSERPQLFDQLKTSICHTMNNWDAF